MTGESKSSVAESHVAGFFYVEHIPDMKLFYDRSAGGAILMSIMLAAGRRTDVFVGGRLNAIFPGESEPRDAVAELREIGVIPCTTVSDLAESLASAKVG